MITIYKTNYEFYGSTYVLCFSLSENIKKQIDEWETALDALHLALAEAAGEDYFCTCDDKFLKKAKAMTDLKTKAVSPIELGEVIEQ